MYRPAVDAPPEATTAEPADHTTVEPPHRRRIEPRSVAVLATLLASGLALFHLGHKSYWLDEGYSIGHARLPWDQFWSVLTNREPNGALHSLILFGWIRISDAEWWVRLPSAVGAVATVPLLYLLLRRLFDDRVGAVGAVLLAVNAYALQFAQEARPYALVMCMATASTLLFVAYVQDGRRSQWWGWIVLSAVLPYAHLFGFLILAVQATGGLVLRRGLPTATRRLVGGFALIAAATGVLALLIATADTGGQAEGIPGVSPVRFVGVYVRLVGDGGALLLAVVGLIWLSVVVRFARDLLPLRPFEPTERQWGFLYLLAWLTLPTVAIACLSPVQPLFGARYFIILVPAAVGLTALGLTTMPRGRARIAAGALVAALALGSTAAWYQRPAADDLRGASDMIARGLEPGDAAIFLPWFMELPFDPYALRDARLRNGLESAWPETTWGHFLPDHRDHPRADEVAATIAATDRVWLVVRQDRVGADDEDLAAYRRELERDHRQVRREELAGVDVLLYERR